MKKHANNQWRVLRYPDLVEAGIVTNRTTLARWIAQGRFPKPVCLGPNTLAWRIEAVEQFLNKAERGA